jgi:hypothetical protein
MPVLDDKTGQLSVIRLKVESVAGESRICELLPDANLIVGSGQCCGLQLDEPGVSTIQAIFRRGSDGLWLQPWHAEAVLSVNGERVTDDVQLVLGDEVQVGSYRIAVADPVSDGLRGPAAAALDERPPAPATSGNAAPETPAEANDPTSGTHETDSLSGETDADDPLPAGDPFEMPFPDLTDSFENDGGDRETVNLLQAEIALLQSELAERDVQIAELAGGHFAAAEDGAASSPQADREDTVPVSRLQQSLCELEQADQRIAELERLLQLAEEARHAAWDERQQIESWVGQIEVRIEQWMTERRAENDLLQNQLRQSRIECNRLREQVPRAVPSEGGASSAELRQLQQCYAELQESLQRIESERDQLQEQLRQAEANTEHRQQAESESELREERLRLAQQRATLARERSELENVRAALDTGGPEATPKQDVDHRVRAFREHLREIHDQEQEQQAGRGTGSRLARLWRLLDGR